MVVRINQIRMQSKPYRTWPVPRVLIIKSSLSPYSSLLSPYSSLYKYMTVRKKYSGRHQYYKHYCISRKVFLKLLPTRQRCQKNNRYKNESDYKMFHRASANQFRFDTFIEVRPLAVLTINGTSPRQRVDRVVIIRVPCSRFFALSMPSKN